jgi:hypothetical protein
VHQLLGCWFVGYDTWNKSKQVRTGGVFVPACLMYFMCYTHGQGFLAFGPWVHMELGHFLLCLLHKGGGFFKLVVGKAAMHGG